MFGLICALYLSVPLLSLFLLNGCKVVHATSITLPVDHVWAMGKEGALPYVGLASDSSVTVIGLPRRCTYLIVPLPVAHILLALLLSVGVLVAAAVAFRNTQDEAS